MARKKIIAGAVALIILTAALSSFVTMQVVGFVNIMQPSGSKAENQNTGDGINEAYINKFKSVESILKDKFYIETDEATLLNGALSGMAQSVKDNYTYYMTADEYKSYVNSSEGNYAGIGVRVNIDANGLIQIVEIFPNSPAAKSGLKRLDKIIKVDGTAVNKDNYDKCVQMVQGEKGTEVTLTIKRGEQQMDVKVIREPIETPDTEYEMLDGKIGYVKYYSFDSNSGDHFIQAVEALKAQGMKGLILDIRGNLGGYLGTCTQVSDYLLPKGTILTIKGRDGKDQVYTSDEKALNLPLVLLVNESTASAAEVLSGAVRDFGVGTLVGTKTFGKGIVQSYVTLDDGSVIKYTSARYYLPGGDCIQGKGIEPKVQVTLSQEASDMLKNQGELPKEKDNQFQKGLEEMQKLLAQKK